MLSRDAGSGIYADSLSSTTISRLLHLSAVPFSSSCEMPAEPRKPARKTTSEEDIELKRARGEISCAECRRCVRTPVYALSIILMSICLHVHRLKLKCDKKIPCGSCIRRGCTTICPNGECERAAIIRIAEFTFQTGSLSAGQGTR